MEALQFIAEGPLTGEGLNADGAQHLGSRQPKSQGLQILHSHGDIAFYIFMHVNGRCEDQLAGCDRWDLLIAQASSQHGHKHSTIQDCGLASYS